MRVVAGLDQRAFVVVAHQQVVRVPGEQKLGDALVLQLDRVAAIAMHDRADEVRAGGAQCRGLGPGDVDRGAKAQVLGRRHARRLLIREPGQPDAHAIEVEQCVILEVRNCRAGRIAQVRAVEREFRLRHALKKNRLAEIELVIAGHENIRRDHVGQRNDMRAAVEAGHHRRRQRVAAVRHDDVASFARGPGALGLHDRRQTGKSAAALAVGERLLAHQVEIVEQDERDVSRYASPAPRRGASRRARAWRPMRRGRSGGSAWFLVFSLAAHYHAYNRNRHADFTRVAPR